MSQFFEVIKNAQTGEVTTRDFTQEEIDAQVVTVVPAEITKVQLYDALVAIGQWNTFEPMLRANPRWEFVTTIPRNHPSIVDGTRAYFAALGQGDTEADAFLDQVFTLGGTL